MKQDATYMAALKAILLCSSAQKKNDPDTAGILTSLAYATILSDNLRQKAIREAEVADTGKSWKALGEMPDRIDRMAHEIRTVNKSELFAPEDELPDLMGAWAEALRKHLEKIRQPEQAEVVSTQTIRDYLQSFVREVTGKPHDKLVADLLNAAADALGKNPKFDALSLAQARSRRRKKGT